VVVADRDLESAEKVTAELKNCGVSAEAIHIDIGIGSSIDSVFEFIDSRHGRCDVLVNCAGMDTRHTLKNFPDDLWQATLNVNLTGAFRCSQRAAVLMEPHRWGRIINITSVSGIRAGVGRTAYGTSKAALDGLTRQLAIELGPLGITANAVAPGPIETPMAKVGHSEATRQAYYRQIPLRRYGTPEDIAHAVAFLSSENASYVNGHTLPVDGGFVSAGLLEG